MSARQRDPGQIGVLVVALAAVVALAIQGLVQVTDVIIDHARAQSVTDAVTLAVASNRPDVIPALVGGVNATLASLDDRDGDVIVQVRIGSSSATARATTNW